jgi:hypothetical protein
MFKMVKGPVHCEIQSVFCSLNARNIKLADIHRHICEVSGENAMSDGMARKWVRKLSEGLVNVHDELWSGRPSMVKCGHVLGGGDTETGALL